jgi:hypothetical protein
MKVGKKILLLVSPCMSVRPHETTVKWQEGPLGILISLTSIFGVAKTVKILEINSRHFRL